MFGGRNAVTTSGLTWGYYGGRWGGAVVPNGTLTLAANETNRIILHRATGAIELDDSSDLWDDEGTYAHLYEVETNDDGVTGYADHRAGPDGLYQIAAGHEATAGRHSVPIVACAMTPSYTGGCSSLTTIASASNQPDIQYLAFDPATEEYAQFSIPMPKSWNAGAVTAQFIWSHASTTTNFGVVWGIQAVAVGNDDAIAASYGTAQTVTDTGGTTNDLYRSGETANIGVAGSPADEDVVFFRVFRKAADGSDTLAIDARLHAVVLYVMTLAETDA